MHNLSDTHIHVYCIHLYMFMHSKAWFAGLHVTVILCGALGTVLNTVQAHSS